MATTSPCSQAQDTCASTPHTHVIFSLSSTSSQTQNLIPQTPLSPSTMDQKSFFLLPKPSNFVSKLISFQSDLIYNTMVSVFSPVQSLFSFASQSYHTSAQETKHNNALEPSSPITLLLKKLGLGFLSAAYVCMVLLSLLILASVVGVGLVKFWVEEPVFVKQNLHFDYTHAYPSAVFPFDGGLSGFQGYNIKKNHISVPVGHKFEVSLVLLMPESHFNRDLGVFQLVGELLSMNENVIAKSSQPCMLRYRSSPVQLARTVMMGLPLVLGISDETQKINVEILRHKEGYNRTKSVRVTLHPRAGTSSIPQIYEAEIVVKSHLPWAKEFVRNWKWTFYIWVSLYVYIVLLLFLLCCYRPLLFSVTAGNNSIVSDQRETSDEEVDRVRELGDESEVSELLRKWRSKRKAAIIGNVTETIGSSASSISMSRTTREDVTSLALEDDDHDHDVVEDSESVCLG